MSNAVDVVRKGLEGSECWCLNDWTCRRCQALEAFEEIQRDLAAARRDLAEYGSHRLGCTKIGRNPFSTDCTCGLAAALADAPEARTAGQQEVLEAEDERSGMEGTA